MTDVARADLFLQFSRRKMAVLLVLVLVLGAIGLALMLTPVGPTWRSIALASVIPVALAILVVAHLSVRSRRWAPTSPEVALAMQDEWRKTNMDRASRTALAVLLVAQWPLGLVLGFFTHLPQPRGALAMATATITLGIATQLGSFLFWDRD